MIIETYSSIHKKFYFLSQPLLISLIKNGKLSFSIFIFGLLSSQKLELESVKFKLKLFSHSKFLILKFFVNS